MPEYRVNERCIIGMPACGYGFGSSRMCFIARPADGVFQLEEDILRQLLKDRNYDCDVALQRIDPGNFAFCTKICSKIITSQFCIVLLNNSTHKDHPEIKIPNPNVHLEFGMMLSFHKHAIPMQRASETLPFNIYPLDTVKYQPEQFRDKAESAIDDAILRFKTKEPPGRPIGPASELLKYMAFSGLRFTDISANDFLRTVFQFGALYGFSLFDGEGEIVFFGPFAEEEPREIAVRLRFLLGNVAAAYSKLDAAASSDMKNMAIRLFQQIRIVVVVPEGADVPRIETKVQEFQRGAMTVPVALKRPSDITAEVQANYDSIDL